MNKFLPQITQLLMGAAFADKRLDGRELGAARRLILQLVGSHAMPRELSDIMVHFQPDSFDIETTVAPLRTLPKAAKRRIIELIATMNEADEHIDLSEDIYLEAVAVSLGLEPADYKDLTLDGLDDSEIVELSSTDLTLLPDE